MVRLFVPTSHICTLYMIIYARQTNNGKYKDVLVLDGSPKKTALKKVIIDTQKIYPWHTIIDLSPTLSDNADFTISTRKNITQKLRSKFFIKPFYHFLLNIYLKQKGYKETQIINEKLKDDKNVTEINLLTQPLINRVLLKEYPKANVNYFEHGIGDYLFVQRVKQTDFDFFALFSVEFKKFLNKKNRSSDFVKKIESDNFNLLAQEVIEKDENAKEIKSLFKIEGKIVLILLENVHLYEVPDSYWTDYLELCLSKISNQQEYTYILKPHPLQSHKSLEISKNYMFVSKKLNTLIIENSHTANYSIEVLYALFEKQTEHVFSVFSSGVFYISKLYQSDKTKFYHAYDFFKLYYKNALPEYIEKYDDFGEVVKNVFTERCINMVE